MSWLFGLNRGQQGGADVPPFPGPPDSGGNGDDKPGDRQGQKIGEGYRFDSAALERAARAAKELEKSRMAFHLVLCCCEPDIFKMSGERISSCFIILH
jgi:ATPase family AAA domain-containing protein 3A/B